MRGNTAGYIVPAFSLVLLFIIGYATGQTGIPVEDGGEFLTVARLGGVNHPPGLPLVSLSARLSWALFGREGLRVLFALFAAAILVLADRKHSVPSGLFCAGILLLPAVAGRLLMWDAYSPLLLVFAAALVIKPRMSLEGGYLTGLAMAVHPQGVLLPVLCRWRNVSPLKFLGGLVLGASLYLALPVYSAAGAVVDWGSTGNVANFLRQVSAGGYREVYGASMGGIPLHVLLRHLNELWSILWPVLLVPFAIGAAWMFSANRRLMVRLEILLAADLLFVTLVNPMAAGTTQTATLSLLVMIVFSIYGFHRIERWNRAAGYVAAAAAVGAGVMLWQPLPDQSVRVHDYFSGAPIQSAFFLRDNDLLYGGWVMKYVDDRRPDIALLSTGNFSGWFERMVNHFNPDIDLSTGILDVGDLSMPREQAASLLIDATVRDNPQWHFFSDI